MRILVAEDDAPLAEFLHQRLQQEQFSVHMVADGGEAQRLASDQPYDFVILDLNSPPKAGWMFCATSARKNLICPS